MRSFSVNQTLGSTRARPIRFDVTATHGSLREKSEACGDSCLNDSEVATVQREDRAVAESFGKGDDGGVGTAEA